ncbi:hypothetical protein, partial [Halorussus litoreus]|uniref:hypothetical protein n=1 Tax=Halorussus litoreus TaxID=1710536 RepID=UPI001E4B9381
MGERDRADGDAGANACADASEDAGTNSNTRDPGTERVSGAARGRGHSTAPPRSPASGGGNGFL